MTPAELLQVYDEEVRATFLDRLPPGWTGERDGPVARCLTPRMGFAMLVEPATSLDPAELADLVGRTVARLGDGGRAWEWKTFDHDRSDLLPLLEAAGGSPQNHEALVLGEAAPLAGEPVLPAGLAMREVTARADLERIAAMESEVWGEDWSWLADDLADRLTGDHPVRVLVVEDTEVVQNTEGDGGRVVSAAWLAPLGDSHVAGLWGGSTLAAYRGRGVYRALVARRAQLAVDLGYRYLQVDASDDSRPILERLGLRVVGGTTPYLFGDATAV